MDGHGEMQIYREVLPPRTLAAQVTCLWLHEVRGDADYEHRTVPNGSVELAVCLGDGETFVVGPQRAPLVERLTPGAQVIGLRLRPGVAPGVLGAPASEILDRRVTLDELWGREGGALAEQLRGAETVNDAARLLVELVTRRLRGAPQLDPTLTQIVDRLQPWRRSAVGELARDLFLSQRQLRRRTVAAFGFGPKRLQRMLRFQFFLALSQQHRDVSVGRLAALAGYADQAHLTRESVELAALPPAQFLEETRSSCGANHDHSASFFRMQQMIAARR